MGYSFNPFTGNLDLTDTSAAAGADTQVQYNSSGSLAGSADLTWDDTAKELGVGGNIAVPSGSQSAPSLTFTGDTNTGLYSPGANQLALSTNGTGRLFVDSSGRVGIGTTSPGAILHTVNTSAGAARVGAFIQNSSLTVGTEVRLGFAPNTNLVSDNRYSWIGAVNETGSNGSSLTFATTPGGQSATEKMRIDDSGRLLVGTSSDSGGALLQVNGDRIRVATAKTPVSASDTGTTGEICWDASYIYVCTATNTWKRAALSTW